MGGGEAGWGRRVFILWGRGGEGDRGRDRHAAGRGGLFFFFTTLGLEMSDTKVFEP